MRLYSSNGRCDALVHERPIASSANEVRGAGYRAAASAPCDRCGATTIRERCAAHPQIEPTDRTGGYYSPWILRCLDCFLRSMADAYAVEPRRVTCGGCGAPTIAEMLAGLTRAGDDARCGPCFVRAIDAAVDCSSSGA